MNKVESNKVSLEDFEAVKLTTTDPKKIKSIAFSNEFSGRNNYPKRIEALLDAGVSLTALSELAEDERKKQIILRQRIENGEKLNEKDRRVVNKDGRGRLSRIAFDYTTRVKKAYLSLTEKEIEFIAQKRKPLGKKQAIGTKLLPNKELRDNQINGILRQGGVSLDSPVPYMGNSSGLTRDQMVANEVRAWCARTGRAF